MGMGRVFFRFDWESHGIWLMVGLLLSGCFALGALTVIGVWALMEATK